MAEIHSAQTSTFLEPCILVFRRENTICFIPLDQTNGFRRTGANTQATTYAFAFDDFVGVLCFIDSTHLTSFFCADSTSCAGIRIDMSRVMRVDYVMGRNAEFIDAPQNMTATTAAITDVEMPTLYIPRQMNEPILFGLLEQSVSLLFGDGSSPMRLVENSWYRCNSHADLARFVAPTLQ
jgi:hypothetical protein